MGINIYILKSYNLLSHPVSPGLLMIKLSKAGTFVLLFSLPPSPPPPFLPPPRISWMTEILRSDINFQQVWSFARLSAQATMGREEFVKFMNQLTTVILNTNSVISQSLRKTRLARLSPCHLPQSQGGERGSPRFFQIHPARLFRWTAYLGQASVIQYIYIVVHTQLFCLYAVTRNYVQSTLFWKFGSYHYLWQRPLGLEKSLPTSASAPNGGEAGEARCPFHVCVDQSFDTVENQDKQTKLEHTRKCLQCTIHLVFQVSSSPSPLFNLFSALIKIQLFCQSFNVFE